MLCKRLEEDGDMAHISASISFMTLQDHVHRSLHMYVGEFLPPQ